MKLRKQIRKQAAQIVDQTAQILDRDSRLELARTDWRETHAVLMKLRKMHTGYEAPSLYGRHGARELRCKECVTAAFPCDTSRAIDQLLDRKATR